MSDVKKPIRRADVGELEADLKKDLAEEEAKQTMAEYIERGPLLEAFKAKCCEDCPGGYDRAKCKSWCDAADEIALVEDTPAVVPDVQRWRDAESDPPDDNREVIVYRPGVGSTMGIFDNEIHKRWIDANTFMFLEGVTHWMEQPEPPKGDECNV